MEGVAQRNNRGEKDKWKRLNSAVKCIIELGGGGIIIPTYKRQTGNNLEIIRGIMLLWHISKFKTEYYQQNDN
jgi:hypothetical protein